MGTALYKQWYKPRNERKIAAYNLAHLCYIATRPGCIYNHECGFGLWGNIKECGMSSAQNINDLELAKRAVRDISNRLITMYRTVISLEGKDAKRKGYDNREKWQELVSSKVKVIAKENDIDLNSFSWCAAYHHARGHPHVHLLFWDSSHKIRDEYIGDERFKIMTEKIRAELNREIFADEIKNLQKLQKETDAEIRSKFDEELASFIPGLNVELDSDYTVDENGQLMFNIKDLEPELMKKFLEGIIKLEAKLPQSGSLKYKYLPEDAKKVLNELSDMLLKTDAFSELKKNYLKLAEDVARQYGNDDKSVKFNVEKASETLHRNLGNSILKTFKQNKLKKAINEYRYSLNNDLEKIFNKHVDLSEFENLEKSQISIEDRAIKALKDESSNLGSKYKEFLNFVPSRLTPAKEWMTDEVREKLHSTVKELMQTEPFKTEIYYSCILPALASAEDDTVEKPEPELYEGEDFINSLDFLDSMQFDEESINPINTEPPLYSGDNYIGSLDYLDGMQFDKESTYVDEFWEGLDYAIPKTQNDVENSTSVQIEQKLENADNQAKSEKEKVNGFVMYDYDKEVEKAHQKRIISKVYSDVYKKFSSLIYNEATTSKGWNEQATYNIVSSSLLSIFRCFEDEMRDSQRRLPNIFAWLDRSHQAKKEIAMKLKSKGLDWEEYER